MSKMKYKLEVLYSDSKQVRVSSEVARMGPETLPMGNSDWNSDNWDENHRARKLIRAIGDKKKFGFFTQNTTENDYWWYRYKKGDTIDFVSIKMMGDGFTKKVNIYEVKVVPSSYIPMPVGGKWFCLGYTLEFNNSDIDSGWSLSS